MNAKKADVDVLRKVKEHVRNGTYLLREHAIERQTKHRVNLPDVLRVLEHGRHEKEKDIFEVKNQQWKHAIRGKTINGVDLRVIVAFHEKMAIITVIRID
jgi:predicted RNA-binding protein